MQPQRSIVCIWPASGQDLTGRARHHAPSWDKGYQRLPAGLFFTLTLQSEQQTISDLSEPVEEVVISTLKTDLVLDCTHLGLLPSMLDGGLSGSASKVHRPLWLKCPHGTDGPVWTSQTHIFQPAKVTINNLHAHLAGKHFLVGYLKCTQWSGKHHRLTLLPS